MEKGTILRLHGASDRLGAACLPMVPPLPVVPCTIADESIGHDIAGARMVPDAARPWPLDPLQLVQGGGIECLVGLDVLKIPR